MGHISKEMQRYYMERIRSVLIVNPDASLRTIKKTLANDSKAPVSLSIGYIAKLKKKILAKRAMLQHRANVFARLAEIEEKKRELDKLLWKEATKENNTASERIAAMRELMNNELKLLQAQMDSGLFERHIGTLSHAVVPVPDEHKIKIAKALAAHGVIDVDAKIIETKVIESKSHEQEKSKNRQ